MNKQHYHNAIDLLKEVATPYGFLASAQDISNYKRIWARDGVICGLAALASDNIELIETFQKTLETLVKHQHPLGTIPSNVLIKEGEDAVSYGGLAGRVDAVTWFVIGICQYSIYTNDRGFFKKHSASVEKCFSLLDAWEFNNKHLIYVPLSGNWADEYITDGYVLYDQLLRIWALQCYNHFAQKKEIELKIKQITQQIEINFLPNSVGEKYHDRAYKEIYFQGYMPCSFSPSGYKMQFDAFANSLALLLNIGSASFQKSMLNYAMTLASETNLGLVPAFWPPIFEQDEHWQLLKNNCKYEFRNHPFEFHNGGSWPMVNGFFGLALVTKQEEEKAKQILEKINHANAKEDNSFYENFNTKTTEPNGVAKCAWSAAATILLHQSIYHSFKIVP